MQTRSTWRQHFGSGQVLQLTFRVQMAEDDSRLDLGSTVGCVGFVGKQLDGNASFVCNFTLP